MDANRSDIKLANTKGLEVFARELMMHLAEMSQKGRGA